jgi:ABC-type nitrate/sulfonate/bicarbonate transport system substrate-binding protein
MTTGTFKRRGILGLVAAGATGLRQRPACATPGDDLTGTLNVSTFKQTSYLTAYYLQRFAPPGMKINIIETTSNTDAIDALVTGDIDVGYMGVIACLVAASRGRPLQAVASVASRTTRIMVRTDSPYKTMADLKGKSVGIAKATNQDIIFRELAREAGLDPKKDIDYILVPTPSHVEALANHTVEAVSTSEPNGSILLLSGIGRELVTDVNHTRVGNPGILVALTADMIAKRPALARAFVTMHAKTTVWMLHNTEQLITDFAKMARLKDDVIRLAMSNTAHHYNIDDTYMKNIAALSESLADANYVAAGYDVRKAFDLQFLPQARQAAGEVV